MGQSEQAARAARRRAPFARRGTTRYDRVARFGVVAWSLVGGAIVAYLLLRMLAYLAPLLAPVLLATVVIVLLNPVVGLLERHGVPRLAGTALCYLVLIGVVVLLVWTVLPPAIAQVRTLVANLPQTLDRAQRAVARLAGRYGVDLGGGQGGGIGDFLQRHQDAALRALTGVRAFASSFARALAVSVAAVIVAFYTLVQLPRLRGIAVALLPPERRDELIALGSRIQVAVGGYVRGQLLVAAYVGVASSLALWLLHLPYAFLVGAIAGITNLIPLIGPFIGGAIAVGIALANAHPLQALWAALALLAVQQVDNHLITPNVMARTVALNPIAVILGLLLLGSLWGFLGALIAVPFLAVLKLVFEYLWPRLVPWSDDLLDQGDERQASAAPAAGPPTPPG